MSKLDLVARSIEVPDFIIIGAQRSGTTSLYNFLTSHPSVLRARRKEIHFFSKNFSKGLVWYQAQFPFARQEGLVTKVLAPYQKKKKIITGEATPYYIFHPKAPMRAAQTVPHAKLIVLLRNPVERAYSHYNHEVKRQFETLTFEAAIEREEERLRGESDKSYVPYPLQH